MPPDRLDELEDAWQPERPTKERLKRIERSGPPESYPPKSSSPPGKHWTPAGVVLVLGAVSALSVTLGAVLGPFFTKPDLSGYVKREELAACQQRAEAKETASDKAIGRERDRTNGCYDRLGACQSQLGGKTAVIESMEEERPKRRGR